MKEDIPLLCEYALFTMDGQYTGGSIDQEDGILIWTTCIENGRTSDTPYLYSVINREEEILILRHHMAAQFGNSTLRSIFPSADLLLIIIILLEILLSLIIISFIFGKNLGRKIDKLLTVVHKIEQQDLDFEIQKSRLFEVDRALDALDHMRVALRQSLSKQWYDDKMRQEQLSALAHDLKTPLTIIRGNTELLFDTSLSTEQRECAEFIENSSLQMQDYVQTLIEATKSWDSCQPCMKKVNMDSLLMELKNQIDGLCAVNNISLYWDCGQYPAYVTADHDLLIRMLVNVLSNAVEHTPQGGNVTFEICEKNNELSFLITDTGKGFSDEALKHATEQFFMDDDSRSSKSHYGIGLYVAASIAKRHNGKIILENSDAAGGAKVTIQIPY
ncbi:MAG: HAMP domain-containing histidine kinase [Lachnospiraceae bacterium]|nr:HAMP domain-containing histidine kinase [Lachnospiraceae bacterium]